MSEEACLEAFPVVQTGIELILDEKIVQREKAEKISKARKAIPALVATLPKPGVNKGGTS